MRHLRAADLFCGAGGTSCGAESSGAARVLCAVNHWSIACETHAANFPHAIHINSRLDEAHPSECPRIDLLFASPECTHHSRARGGRPTSDQQRAGAWDLMRWVEHHRPSWIVVENVSEFRSWGPVGANGRPLVSGRGRLFDAWLAAIKGCGYVVDDRLLNAADYGAPTSRERLFVIARKGNRAPIWPEPTHGRRAGGELPGLGLRPRRAAAEVIDWTIPCPSVFLRPRPLADKTLARIEAGLRRFVGPFVAVLRSTTGAVGTGGTTRSLDTALGTVTAGGHHHALAVPFHFATQTDGAPKSVVQPVPAITTTGGDRLAVPLLVEQRFANRCRDPLAEPVPTLTTGGNHAVAVPYLVPFFGERDGQGPRSHALDEALPTITASDHKGFVVPFLASVNHGDNGDRHGRTAPLGDPLRTITSSRSGSVVVPFVVSYYGQGDALDVRRPLGTVTTKDRCGLVRAIVETAPSIAPRSAGERRLVETMAELGVCDIGFRMLVNRELAAAQGFPADYRFVGTKTEVTRQVGNAVCPPVAEAITRAIAG